MKNFTRALLFLPILILLTACPYETKVPISEADKPVDANLLGKWYKDGEVDKEYPEEYYNIVKDNDNSYKIAKMELNSEDSTYKEEVYISHITRLQDLNEKKYQFLNMRKDGTYYLHRIELSNERFVLYEVTDNIDEKFNTNDELKKFVENNMHLSFFYNKDEVTYYKGDHQKN